MRRTKIVCTIGPASRDEATLERLIDAGLDVARLNMSHGTHAEHGEVIERVRRIAEAKGRPVALLQDLSGAKIRLGKLARPIELRPGDRIRLTTENVVGEADLLPVRYPALTRELGVGDRLSMVDGTIMLEVEERSEKWIDARVVSGGGKVTSHKGLNLPTGGGSFPALTEKDIEDLRWGVERGFDWVALSFVRSADDAAVVRRIMDDAGRRLPLIAKIEKQQAVDDIDRIVETFDGLMVARGDLGIETSLEEVPGLQKDLIRRANAAGKPVITATQILLSMVASPRPTRAEVNDIANAILDGTDALMLSEETAQGQFPVEAVETLATVGAKAEGLRGNTFARVGREETPIPVHVAISRAAHTLARYVEAAAIVTPTTSGSTARLVAATRPPQPILALSHVPETVRQLSLTWGVEARHVETIDHPERFFELARKIAVESNLAKPGDRLVITAGLPLLEPGSTNMVEVLEA